MTRTRTSKGKKPLHRDASFISTQSPPVNNTSASSTRQLLTPISQQQQQQTSIPSMSPAAAMCVAKQGQAENSTNVNKALQVIVDVLTAQNGTGVQGLPLNHASAPVTSMETEYIEALYAASSADLHGQSLAVDQGLKRSHLQDRIGGDFTSGSEGEEEEEEDLDFDELGSYDDHGDEGDCEQESEEELDAYEHDDFLSSQEAILMELRREQVEFEENVRQLQQQLQRQGSMLPLSPNDTLDLGLNSDPVRQSAILLEESSRQAEPDANDLQAKQARSTPSQSSRRKACTLCPEQKSSLCLEKMGWAWRPLVVEALATAAAAITLFKVRKNQRPFMENAFFPTEAARASVNEGLSHDHGHGQAPYYANHLQGARMGTNSNGMAEQEQFSGDDEDSSVPRHTRYPLPPNSPYAFRRKASEYLEPVGEFQEFQSAEGNSRQVLMHVWPPSELDSALLRKLEACCKDFQENEVVRGHSGDGFLNGWRPAWREPNRTGVLRFGHWRVRSPESPEQLYAPFQTPLTLAAGGGSVLGSTVNLNLDENLPIKDTAHTQQRSTGLARGGNSQQGTTKSDRPVCVIHGHQCSEHVNEASSGASQRGPDQQLESLTQKRLLRLIRAIQMVEKGIIARHLKYLFPTLYEKYHGLQFGTPRLFDAVATVAMAMDVAPRLHHDRAHTRHGFCWIIACGDFIGGDLCIPELGKRVVMRPGTVVAIRSTVVAYYIERYAKGTSMYTMYAYTADNCWPPALE